MYYDTPINIQMGGLELMIREEQEKKILHAVRQIGIDIDKEGLIEALSHDQRRYDEAYQKGWNDCKEYYEVKLKKIIELASTAVKPED